MSMLHHHRQGPPQGRGHYSPDGHTWFDEDRHDWLTVLDKEDRLVIALEDVGASGWLASLLSTLSMSNGEALSRFVGHAISADPRWPAYRYDSDTFARVRAIPDTLDADERWVPGMTDALHELCERLEAEGWHLVAQGDKPWALTYLRPALAWPDFDYVSREVDHTRKPTHHPTG